MRSASRTKIVMPEFLADLIGTQITTATCPYCLARNTLIIKHRLLFDQATLIIHHEGAMTPECEDWHQEHFGFLNDYSRSAKKSRLGSFLRRCLT